MFLVILRSSLVLISIIAWALSDQSALVEDDSLPEWLSGKPDIDQKSDRCAVYEWFFNEADSQTEGIASRDDLASMRLINIANKLVDHHLSSPSESYGAEIKFLVIGRDRGPFDFEFQVSNVELARIMDQGCGE